MNKIGTLSYKTKTGVRGKEVHIYKENEEIAMFYMVDLERENIYTVKQAINTWYCQYYFLYLNK